MVFLNEYKSIFDILKYIENIDRVGCDPFKYICKKKLINQYKQFKLVELNWDTKIVDWTNIINYSPSPISRICSKITDTNKQKYYINHVYNDVLKHPPVIGYNGIIIDGSHRLCKIHEDRLKFKSWIPV
jgi:hypothetical protein